MTALKIKRLIKQANTFSAYFARIEKIFDYSLKELGHRIRQDMILPTCKKHDLEFYSDGSVFFFVRGELDISATDGIMQNSLNENEAHKIFKEAGLDHIFPLLELEVLNNKRLGYYVSEIRKDEFK